jgi:hypothetical protein
VSDWLGYRGENSRKKVQIAVTHCWAGFIRGLSPFDFDATSGSEVKHAV